MAAFRLERATDANGVSERIVDDHGVIALVKARGKRIEAGRLLAAAPEMLEALKLIAADVEGYEAWQRPCHALDVVLAAIGKAEGR